jgi:hypothetical protein
MCSLKFVERSEQQGHEQYANLGRAAACTLRLTKPWHNERPCILLADAWLSGMPTSFALMQKGLYSVVNVKTHTNLFSKKHMWEEALSQLNPGLLSLLALSAISRAMPAHTN